MANRYNDRNTQEYDRGRHVRRGERGFVDRAADEVRSWFGDDEAERRRRMDERRGYTGGSYSGEFGGGRHTREDYGGGREEWGRDRDYYGRGDYSRSDYENRGDWRDYGREAGRDYGRDYERNREGYRGRYPGEFSRAYNENWMGRGYGGQGWGAGYPGYGGGSGRSPWSREGGQWGTGYRGSWGTAGSAGYAYDDRAQEGERRGRYAGRGPTGYQRSDQRIMEDVNDRLTDDPDVDATHILVTVRGGEVILEGNVEDRESKRRAEDIAESISGVKDVQNHLKVGRPEESGTGPVRAT